MARPIRCTKGYKFKMVGRKKVALMRGRNQSATFQCDCETTGGCKVNIDPTDPQTITCLESGCTGSCGWVIKIAGIAGLTFRV